MALLNKLKSIFKAKKRPKIEQKVEVAKKTVRPSPKKHYFHEVYKILQEPHVSEKATILNDKDKYIFKVYPRANKTETKKAVESLYGVRVKNVNIINVHRKRKLFKGKEGFKSGYKKAIVTLEEGQKIEIQPH